MEAEAFENLEAVQPEALDVGDDEYQENENDPEQELAPIVVAYEYSLFAEAEATKLQSYKCGICHDVSRLPYNLECAHLFCGACLRQDQAFKKAKHAESDDTPAALVCPICKTSVSDIHADPKAMKLNMHVKLDIEGASMSCPHRDAGCDLVFVIGCDERNMQDHLRECLWVMCSDCKEIVKRTDLTDHETDICAWRRVACKFCGDVYHAKDLDVHLTEKSAVDDMPLEYFTYHCASSITCTNGCTDIVHIAKFVEHKAVCPFETLPCELGERHLVKCTESIQRSQMLDHIRVHMHGDLADKMTRLETQIQQTTANATTMLKKVQNQINELSAKVALMQSPVVVSATTATATRGGPTNVDRTASQTTTGHLSVTVHSGASPDWQVTVVAGGGANAIPTTQNPSRNVRNVAAAASATKRTYSSGLGNGRVPPKRTKFADDSNTAAV